MNADILAKGQAIQDALRKLQDDITDLLADPPVNEPWPGYTAERARYADSVTAELHRLRSDLGILTTVLAQDSAR